MLWLGALNFRRLFAKKDGTEEKKDIDMEKKDDVEKKEESQQEAVAYTPVSLMIQYIHIHIYIYIYIYIYVYHDRLITSMKNPQVPSRMPAWALGHPQSKI